MRLSLIGFALFASLAASEAATDFRVEMDAAVKTASAEAKAGDAPGAVARLDDVLKRLRNDGADPLALAGAYYTLGDFSRQAKDLPRAERAFRAILDLVSGRIAPDHASLGTTYAALAGVLAETGRDNEAIPLFRKADAIVRKGGRTSPQRLGLLHREAQSLERLGRHAEAEPLLRTILATVSADPQRAGLVGRYRSWLADLVTTHSRAEEAAVIRGGTAVEDPEVKAETTIAAARQLAAKGETAVGAGQLREAAEALRAGARSSSAYLSLLVAEDEMLADLAAGALPRRRELVLEAADIEWETGLVAMGAAGTINNHAAAILLYADDLVGARSVVERSRAHPDRTSPAVHRESVVLAALLDAAIGSEVDIGTVCRPLGDEFPGDAILAMAARLADGLESRFREAAVVRTLACGLALSGGRADITRSSQYELRLSTHLAASGRVDEALQRAERVRQRLAERYGSNSAELAAAYSAIATHQVAGGDVAASLATVDRGLALSGWDTPRLRFQRVHLLLKRASNLAMLDRLEESEAALREGVLYGRQIGQGSDIIVFPAVSDMVETLLQRGRARDAVALLGEINLPPPAAGTAELNTLNIHFAGFTLRRAEAHAAIGAVDEARQALMPVLPVIKAFADRWTARDDSGAQALGGALANQHDRAATLLLSLGEIDEARRISTRAEALWRALDPERFRLRIAGSRDTLGRIERSAGRTELALALAEEALSIASGASMLSDHLTTRLQDGAGHARLAAGRTDEALAAFRAAGRLIEKRIAASGEADSAGVTRSARPTLEGLVSAAWRSAPAAQ